MIRETIYITAFNERSSEMFLIELPKIKALSVLSNFDDDYGNMCRNLDIIKNRLVILNPSRG